MLIAFFESIKYIGHQLPVALLRIFLGYYYFNEGLQKIKSDFLTSPKLAEMISDGLAINTASPWYQIFLDNIVVYNWKTFSHLIVLSEILVGVSFLVGYLVRPMAVLGVILSVHYLLLFRLEYEPFYKLLIVSHIVLAWIGAGRCLGIDYFFYKRNRGILW